jgi:hypothetical protein
MAFADAVFDGRARLEGVDAIRVSDFARARELLGSRQAIPVYVRPLGPLLKVIRPKVRPR